ncbi:MAG: M23 family metallopeptidase [Candidatus Cloacimonas sp.]|nr:M23 family metallopeptidase [Candidatus Cloacimonadota bacterium]
MLKKILLTISVILLLANFFLLIENKGMKSELKAQTEEILTLRNQSQILQDVIASYKYPEIKNGKYEKERKIRELLDSYLGETNKLDPNPITSIATEELKNELSEYEMKQRFVPDLFPIKTEYAVSQPFTEQHKGVDIAAPLGTEITAAGAGVVKAIYNDKYYGNAIIIDHFNGYHSFYAHMERVLVKQGFFIDKGEVIGLVGSTGYSVHPHLHYEIIEKGVKIDPKQVR